MRAFLSLILAFSLIIQVACNPLLLLTGVARAIMASGAGRVLVNIGVRNAGQILIKLLGDRGSLFLTPACGVFDFPLLPCKENSTMLQQEQGGGTPLEINIDPGKSHETSFDLSDYFELSKLPAGTYEFRVRSSVRVFELGALELRIPLVSEAIPFTWPPSE
ncbi:unnamed protein product [Rhizoctonia solani]|uniref:Uncharacterized protein n=1 Tax=Rhizoctonia solani TaxID=456999 RepID=A0A8H3H834_9AGAM|nr:unnamed protein product [Rhizoctonia solani]